VPPFKISAVKFTALPPTLPPLAALQLEPAEAAHVHAPLSVTPSGKLSAIVAAVTSSGPLLVTIMV